MEYIAHCKNAGLPAAGIEFGDMAQQWSAILPYTRAEYGYGGQCKHAALPNTSAERGCVTQHWAIAFSIDS